MSTFTDEHYFMSHVHKSSIKQQKQSNTGYITTRIKKIYNTYRDGIYFRELKFCSCKSESENLCTGKILITRTREKGCTRL
jgi:hypothetical protein